jgi:hypothetical protein
LLLLFQLMVLDMPRHLWPPRAVYGVTQ